MSKVFLQMEKSLPELLFVGKGTVYMVSGFCFHPEKIIRKIIISIGERIYEIQNLNECISDRVNVMPDTKISPNQLNSGFHGWITFASEIDEGSYAVKLRVEFIDREEYEHELGEIQILNNPEMPSSLKFNSQRDPVAICLASYNPDLVAFSRQIDSILSQSHKNWVCIINDDASDIGTYQEIKKICSRDERFYLYRNTKRLGFYRNFEMCLRKVPENAKYIALSDQDDYWYINKLSLCIEGIGTNNSLVYSDMRITDQSGSIISETFWGDRKRNHSDLSILLVSNSVTGAASLFRRELLSSVLPFPDAPGRCMHDHWIACVAFMSGPINYINTPLYDYIQHDNNAIGYNNSYAPQVGQKKFDNSFVPVIYTRLSAAVKRIVNARSRYNTLYRNGFYMVYIFSRTLILRFNNVSRRNKKSLNIVVTNWKTVPRLFMLFLKVLIRGETTNVAEGLLVTSYMHNALGRIKKRCLIRHIGSTGGENI